MYYLKCTYCGHLNEVKGEYLIFCSHCNKKLNNNFSDWRKRNPERSFDDFKQLICISDETILQENTKVKPSISKSSKSTKYWIGFTFAFALAILIFYAIEKYGTETIVKFFRSEKTSEEALNKKWTKQTYGGYGLTVETPAPLNRGELAIPDNVKQFVDKMDTYNYLSEKGFKIMINSIKYNQVVGTVNLQSAADGSANEAKMQKGVTDFTYNEDYVYLEDIPGFIQKGTFKTLGIEYEFINAGYAKGLNLWQVWVGYQADDETGRIAADRVIKSIEIKKDNKAL